MMSTHIDRDEDSEEDCELEDSFVVVETSQKRYRSSIVRLLGASLCIVIAIASWVMMAEKLQKLNEQYKKPYFLSYWVHSFYAMMYVFWQLWRSFPGNFSCNSAGDGAFPKSRQLVIAASVIQIVALLSGYTWYLSLSRTNIPANTSIYQCACAIVFIISVPVLKERVTALKVMCVLFSIAGVSLVAVYSSQNNCNLSNSSHNTSQNASHDQHYQSFDGPVVLTHISKGGNACAENSTPIGYILLVVSVVCYGVFEVFYKKFATKKGDPAAVQNGVRFLGYMGIHTVLWMWPPILIVHFAGLEKFEWPTLEIIGLMFLNGTLDVIFNISLLICIALSSPLFASVGTILAIPTAVIVDWIIQGFVLPPLAFIGIFFIIVGFVGFILSEVIAARRESHIKEHSTEKQLQIQASMSEKRGERSPLIAKEEQNWTKLIISHLV